jgi:hypothetical protein
MSLDAKECIKFDSETKRRYVNRERFRNALREIRINLGTCTQKMLRGKEQDENKYPEKLYKTIKHGRRPGMRYGQIRKRFSERKTGWEMKYTLRNYRQAKKSQLKAYPDKSRKRVGPLRTHCEGKE